ncbi:MAG TPA: protein kinase [Gemmataceae bacterium]|nr:protein kinase [Gemmataceae bacterium]
MSKIHDYLAALPRQRWREIQDRLEEFESAWESGQPPDLDTFVSQQTTDRGAVLAELAHIDLEYRLKRGEPTRVEDYLKRFPELAADRHSVLELILAECRLRARQDPRLKTDEYVSRFPDFRQELADPLLPLHPRLGAPTSNPVMRAQQGSAREGTLAPGPGVRLGKYLLLEVAGRGACGVVYRAHDPELDRIVAVKLYRLDPLATAADSERFLREARSAAQLRHPHIVSIYETGRDGDVVYLVGEFIDGRSLDKQLREERLSARQAAELMSGVAEAVDHAHRMGVVHRDLKPANILLASVIRSPQSEAGDHGPQTTDYELIPKITDFGLAKRETGDKTLTATGEVLGTPAYMSPEQARGESHKVDARSDVYSLGVVLYELLTGEVPFRGTPGAVLRQVLEDEPRPPRRIDETIPRDLETICLKCMEKEPGRRYAGALALAQDLRRFLAGEPVLARPVGRLDRLGRWCRRKPVVAGLAAGLVVVFCAGFVGVTWEWRQAVQSSTEAQEQRVRAEQHLQSLREAVDKYYTRVSENQLLREPSLQPLRKELLEAARDYYAGFVQEHENDPALRAELAWALFRQAGITRDLGSPQISVGLFEQALAIQEQLVRASPEVEAYQFALAATLNNLGSLTYVLEESEARYRRSLALFQDLARRFPGTAAYRHGVYSNYNNLGLQYAVAWQIGKAEKAYQDAITTVQKLADEEPGNPNYQTDLIRSLMNLGDLCRLSGQLKKAEIHFQAALDLSARFVKEHPGVSSFQRALGGSYISLGLVKLTAQQCVSGEAAAAQMAQARATLETGLVHLRQVARDGPSVTAYQHDLASALLNWGIWCELNGQWVEAENAFTESLARFDKIPSNYDLLARRNGNRELCHLGYAGFLRDIGRTDEALAEYGRLIPSLETAWQNEKRNLYAKVLLCGAYLGRADTFFLAGRCAETLADGERAMATDEGLLRPLLEFQRAFLRARIAGQTKDFHGNYAGAVGAAEGLLRSVVLNGGGLCSLAGTYAVAAAGASGDQRLTPAERTARTEQYAARAVLLLTKAQASGFFIPAGRLALLREGAEFESLRARPDFQKLLAEVQSAAASDDE